MQHELCIGLWLNRFRNWLNIVWEWTCTERFYCVSYLHISSIPTIYTSVFTSSLLISGTCVPFNTLREAFNELKSCKKGSNKIKNSKATVEIQLLSCDCGSLCQLMVQPNCLWKSSVTFPRHDRHALPPLVASWFRIWTMAVLDELIKPPCEQNLHWRLRSSAGEGLSSLSLHPVHTSHSFDYAVCLIIYSHVGQIYICLGLPSPNNAPFSLTGWLHWTRAGGGGGEIVQSGSKKGKKEDQKAGKWDGGTEQREEATIRKWERAREGASNLFIQSCWDDCVRKSVIIIHWFAELRRDVIGRSFGGDI